MWSAMSDANANLLSLFCPNFCVTPLLQSAPQFWRTKTVGESGEYVQFNYAAACPER